MRLEDIPHLVSEQREYFSSGATREVAFRREQLEKLKDMIESNSSRIQRAVHEDLRKPPFEMFASETAFLLAEIDFALRHLSCWTAPVKVPNPPVLLGASSYIYPEPFGTVLIISPWNYPFLLLFAPLVGSIAAGNCAVLKPSEISEHSSRAIAEMVSDTFEPRYIAALEGGMEVNRPLMEERFDYIFFTGSPRVGRAVMESASKHLTPVTLELGGKSPCVVDESARLGHTANRIVFGKFLNAGQTCIAPDYLLVHEKVKTELMEGLKSNIRSFYGKDPKRSRHFARIVSRGHFERLSGLLEEGDIIAGGITDERELYIAPTVIDGLTPEAKVMREEIFGPILPVMSYGDLQEAIDFVNSRPRPLALYLFTMDRDKQKRVLEETSSGGVCINSTLLHESTSTLPFGGVGESGMGGYHGKASFDTFTHYKSVLNMRFPHDVILRTPYPESDIVNRILQRLLLLGKRCKKGDGS
jgi:aldehyde dehydrogenase (NAD+)